MPVNLTQILEALYQEFSDVEKPEHFTKFEHCEECREHNETMKSANLDTLTALHLGSFGWNPLSFLTEQGFAYFMPRLIELLLQDAKFRSGDPFAESMLFQLCPSASFDRFLSYSPQKCRAVLEALKYYKNHSTHDRFTGEDVDKAIQYWQLKSRGI